MLAYVILVLGQALAFFACHRLSQRGQRTSQALLTTVTVLLLAKAVLNWLPDWEARLFPFTDYVLYQGTVLYILAAGFFGCVLAFIPRKNDAVAIRVLALMVAGLGCVANVGLILPGYFGSDIYADGNHHLRQSSVYTCGPASGVIAASYFGIRVSEREMATRCLTNSKGTSLFNIYRGLCLTLDGQQHEVSIVRLGFTEVAQAGRVCVAISGNHAICLVGQGGTVMVHDTMKDAAEEWDADDVSERCDGVFVSVRAR